MNQRLGRVQPVAVGRLTYFTKQPKIKIDQAPITQSDRQRAARTTSPNDGESGRAAHCGGTCPRAGGSGPRKGA